MPTRKAWDHTIDLREEFVPKKKYIRPSKSPQMSPVFFVPKKNGKKRMVQNYQYLNSWMVKNNYLLPLISDLIDSIGKKKAAFSMPEGSFEPMVMFFGLTNSLAMF